MQTRYWHCWIYKTNSIPAKFIYGYAAPSYIAPTDSSSTELSLELDSIVEHYKVPKPEVFKQFCDKLGENSLDLSILGFNLGELAITYKQRSVQNALGATAVVADSYYTFSVKEFPISANGIRRIFGHLQHVGPFNQPEKFMHRLGAFDIIHMPRDAESEVPIVCFRLPHTNLFPAKPRRRDQFEIERRRDIAQEDHIAHVRLFCGETLLDDTIYQLPSGHKIFGPITSNDEFDRSQFWLFNKKGVLVYHEDFNWLNSIGASASIAGQKISLKDELVETMQGTGDKDKVTSLQHVSVHSDGFSSVVHFSTIHEFCNYQREMLERGKAIFGTPTHDKWFPKGALGSGDAVLHLKTLLEDDNIEEAWIVDPFFDIKALEMLIPRVGRKNLKLNIITSLNTIDPGTGKIVSNGDKLPVEELKQALPKVRTAIHCRLKILNLRKSERLTRQAFHDRYICTKTKDEKPTVYLLSNSLNSFMGDYPFCISRMSGDAAKALYDYIINLAAKKDSASDKDLYCNLEWDSSER